MTVMESSKSTEADAESQRQRQEVIRARAGVWEYLTLLSFLGLSILQALWGLISWPFIKCVEEPQLTYVHTPENDARIEACPSLRTFACAPWAIGPHASTFFSLMKFGAGPPRRREYVTMPDGVQVMLDWFEPPGAAADTPVLIGLHGIGGDENAVRPITLAEESLKRGWRSVLYVRRGHGSSSLLPVGQTNGDNTAQDAPATSPLYAGPPAAAPGPTPEHSARSPLSGYVHSIRQSLRRAVQGMSPKQQPAQPDIEAATPAGGGTPEGSNGTALRGTSPGTAAAALDPEKLKATRKAFPQHADTEDFQVVLHHIRRCCPGAPLLAVGFSMGSNVLVKYLGEQGAAGGGAGEPDAKNPLMAAISVCNGYDIIEGTRHLVERRRLADRVITSALHRLLRRRLPEVHAICAANGLMVDFDEVLSINTIREFEAALMLPILGLDDVDAYYSHNNCREALQHVGVPLLCMSARNDPIIHPSLLRHAEAAAAANPNVLLALTQRGGHLGWLSGWGGHNWMMDVICEFAEAVINGKRTEKKLPEGAGVQKQQQQGEEGQVGQVQLQAAGGGGGGGVGKLEEGQGRALSPGVKAAAVLVTAADGMEGEAEGVAVAVGVQEGAAGGAAADGGGEQGVDVGTGEVALVVRHGAGQQEGAGNAGGESGAEGGAAGGGAAGDGDGVVGLAEVVLELEGDGEGQGPGVRS